MDMDEPDSNSDNCNIPVDTEILSIDMEEPNLLRESNISPSPTTPNNAYERSSTPPNSFIVVPDACSSPMAYNNNCDYTDSETSFLKRIAYDQLVRRRFTSTPLQMNAPKFSNSFPGFQHTTTLNDNRQWRSAENKRALKDPEQILSEYVNPFTPDGKLIINRTNAQKRLKKLNLNSAFDNSEELVEFDAQLTPGSDTEVPIRHRLNEFNVSRYNEEFVELNEIGRGHHGRVYKCINMINGCIYAIKKTINPVRSGIEERIIQNEIYAHGVLDHRNIVRNFSSWKEGVHVYIQNEYCNGGNLEDYCQSKMMTESLLSSLLLQMCHALRYIHNKGLAHMDVKPGNILLCIERFEKDGSMESDGGFSEDKCDEVVFKLGDLGHVVRLDEKRDVEEGDCRYLPREILQEQWAYLDRADIFALGLTVYEAAGAGPLPKNGAEWQEIRNGNLKYLDQHTKQFNDILKSMVQPDPGKRPSADQLIHILEPSSPISEDVYLQRFRRTNSVLEHKVEATGLCLQYLYKAHKQLQEKLSVKDQRREVNGSGGGSDKEKLLGVSKKKGGVTKNRVVGRKTKRSSSTTTF